MNSDGESVATVPIEVPIGTVTEVLPDGTVWMEFNKSHPLYPEILAAYASGGLHAVNKRVKEWQAARQN